MEKIENEPVWQHAMRIGATEENMGDKILIYKFDEENQKAEVYCNLCGSGGYDGPCIDCGWENWGSFWLTFEELEERGFDVAAALERVKTNSLAD
jgi:hypothetical protein